MHQVTTMLAGDRVIIKVLGHLHWWLEGGYDLEIGHFVEVASMVITWWITAFLPSVDTTFFAYVQVYICFR